MTNQTENFITQKIEYIRGRLYLAFILMILSIIQLSLMGYWYTLMYQRDASSLMIGKYLALPYLIVFFFNIFLLRIMFLILQLEPFRGLDMYKIFTIWLSSISLMGFIGQFLAVSDIIQEHLTEIYDCSGEFFVLRVMLSINIIFYIILAVNIIIAILYLKKNQNTDIYMYNENIFNRFNLIGLISGLTGIIATLLFTLKKEPLHNWKWIILPYCLILISPYFLYLLHWIVSIKKGNRQNFLDEKQKHDILKAGFTTLIISIPVLVFFFVFNYQTINGVGSILWLPFYLFSILLIFSGASMFFYKKN